MKSSSFGEKFSEWHLQEHEDRGAEQRQRNRAEQNDERIAEAVKLRGQNQENQNDRRA